MTNLGRLQFAVLALLAAASVCCAEKGVRSMRKDAPNNTPTLSSNEEKQPTPQAQPAQPLDPDELPAKSSPTRDKKIPNEKPVPQDNGVDIALTNDPALRARFDRVLVGVIPAQASGLVVAVVRGNSRHVFAYGTTGDGSTTPPDEHTIYEIGSITKVFTGMMLAQLTLDRSVALNDPVKGLVAPHVIPTRSGRDMTLLDLATHTSGLPRIQTDAPPNIGAGILYDMDNTFRFLAGYTLIVDPGTAYNYSNVGAGLLGHALATKVGEAYEPWVVRRICEPLGMHDTRIVLDESQLKRIAKGRVGDARDPTNLQWPANSYGLASGAIQSSALDMMRFLEANLGLRPSPLDAAIASATSPQRPVPGAPPLNNMGLLWQLTPRTGTSEIEISKDGGTAGFASFIIFNKKAQVGLVLLINGSTANPDDLGVRLLNEVYAK